jgi:putative oxidoreductase
MKNIILFFRITLGLILIALSVAYFFNLLPELATTGDFKAIEIGLIPSTYLTPFIKVIELICGLSFLSKRYVTLSNLIVLPVTINILFINYFTASSVGFIISIFIFSGSLVMFYAYWKNYKHLFVA